MYPYPVTSEIVTESDSPVTVNLGAGAGAGDRWSEITVQVFNASGAPVNTSAGTLTGQAVKSGTTKPETFDEEIDLSVDDWSWKPELSTVQQFIFTISGLMTNHRVQFTVHNW